MKDPCAAHGCAACCHDTQMPLTHADVQRLAALGHDAAAFSRIDEATGETRLRTRTPPSEGEPAPCFFLAHGRCSVYEARPEGCRIYPFVLDPDGRVVRDEECPYRDEFPRAPDVGRRLARVVSRLQSEARARTQP